MRIGRRAAELCNGSAAEGLAVWFFGADQKYAGAGEGLPTAYRFDVANGDTLSGS
jgi:hypothetical protein